MRKEWDNMVTDCLPRSPSESATLPEEKKTAFFGVLNLTPIAQQQCDNPELPSDNPELLGLFNYLDSRFQKAPSIFARVL